MTERLPALMDCRATRSGGVLTPQAREQRASDVQDLVVDGCIVAMEEFSTAELLATAERAERTNADGWLPKMIREYLGCWRTA